MKNFIGLFFFFGSVLLAHAVSVTPPSSVTPLPGVNGTPDLAIASIIQYFILFTGVLAVMMITWGGISMILATGDDEKVKKSKKTIIYAFVGVVVAGLAYSIVELITRAQLN